MAMPRAAAPLHTRRKYERLIADAKQVPPAKTVAVHPCDESSLSAVSDIHNLEAADLESVLARQRSDLFTRPDQNAPARSLVSIDDVGAATAFLGRDAARLNTGETLYIDRAYHIID